LSDNVPARHETQVVARSMHGLGPVRSILVLKLDHLGDFIIGEPAMRQLRAYFPQARIRLICGPWNRRLAEATGLFEEVRCYAYFPENARHWDGKPVEGKDAFARAADGAFDLAIDLRVDEDTRFLLEAVTARVRCGIGSRERHRFLDIILPQEHEDRRTVAQIDPPARIGLDQFRSAMPLRSEIRHETDFRQTDRVLIDGPGVRLTRGTYRVGYHCDIGGRGFGLRKVALSFEVHANGVPVATRRLEGRQCGELAGGPVALEFLCASDGLRFDFRLGVSGRPLRGRLGFSHCGLELLQGPDQPRLRRAELHIGEKLSLLAFLVHERTRPLGAPPARPARGERPLVVIAPASNSTLRDWPPARYAALMQLLLDRTEARLALVGAPDQHGLLAGIAAEATPRARVENLAGSLSWPDLPALLAHADLVICNNSGVAHLAASAGTRLLAIYSASHQIEEWGPRGPRAHVLTAEICCAPCGHDILSQCLHGHACMEAITPERVLRESLALLSSD
jgi:ADP-heptose:LPS heptosyltransferase